jgi:hypothetical protein
MKVFYSVDWMDFWTADLKADHQVETMVDQMVVCLVYQKATKMVVLKVEVMVV